MTRHSHEGGVTSCPPPVSGEVPPSFVRVAEVLPPALDRTLGYRGGGRFVSFRYEPRGQEVV